VTALGASLLSCSPGYVLRAAWEEARILARRQPIMEVLNDPSLDAETRGKLELVVQARSFAGRDLHLDVKTAKPPSPTSAAIPSPWCSRPAR
jgi:predicted aminopeptidase